MDEFGRRGAQGCTVPAARINEAAMAIYKRLGMRPVAVTMYKRL